MRGLVFHWSRPECVDVVRNLAAELIEAEGEVTPMVRTRLQSEAASLAVAPMDLERALAEAQALPGVREAMDRRAVARRSGWTLSAADVCDCGTFAAIGLALEGPSERFPVVLGCTLQARSGRLIGGGRRTVDASGPLLWRIEVGTPEHLALLDPAGRGDAAGRAAFAIWDIAVTHTFATSAWVEWTVTSGRGPNDLWPQLESKYGRRDPPR